MYTQSRIALLAFSAVLLFSGDTFAGNCKISDSDISADYSGPCKNGLANGFGVARGRDEYKGYFLNGEKHGQGAYFWADGVRYEGEYAGDKRNGFGKMTIPRNSYVASRTWGKGEWRGDDYIQEGIYENGRHVFQCSSKSDCEKQKRVASSTAEQRSFTKDRNIKIPVMGRSDCFIYYPFRPIPPNLTVRGDFGCSNNLVDAYGYGEPKRVEFVSNGEVDSYADISTNFSGMEGFPCGKGSDPEWDWVFRDGEKWRANSCNWRKIRDNNSIMEVREQESARKQAAREQCQRDFRSRIKAGDDTSDGLIVEVKGDLVKIQTNENQCTQRNYEGSCVNWVKTPVEKWVKRNQVSTLNC